MLRQMRTKSWFKFMTLVIVAGSMSFLTGCAALKNLAQNGELASLLSKVGVDINKVIGSDAKTEIGGQVVEYNDITGESAGIPYAEVSVAIGSTTVTDWADEEGNFRVPVGDISTASVISVTAKLAGQYQSNTTTLKLGTDYSPGYEYVSAGSIVLQAIVGSTSSARISGSAFYGPLPLAGVTITARPTSGSEKTVKTNSSGFYVVTGLPEGTYTLSASLTDFTTKTGPANVAIELNQTVTGNDFVMEPNASAASKYSIKDLGVIKGQMTASGGSSDGGPLPGFILSATATLQTAKTNDNQDIKTFIDQKDSSFVFRGVPVGKHKVKITIKMDPQRFVQEQQKGKVQARQATPLSGIQELSYTYDINSVAIPAAGSLDQISVQKIAVKESDFGFDKFFADVNKTFNTNINLNFNIGGPQTGNGAGGQGGGKIWIEQEVMMRVGNQQNPMATGFVELVPETGAAISTWFQNGRFGMGISQTGAYTLKIYNVDSEGNKTGDALISKKVTIPTQMFDPRGWHIGPIFVTGSADSILKDLETVPVTGRLWIDQMGMNGPVDSTLADGLAVVLQSTAVPSYSVTLNITKQDNQNFQFTASIKPLGQFSAKVVGGSLAIRDPFQNFFVDKFNQPNFDIGLRANAVSSRLIATFGAQEVGVSGAKVQVLKDDVAFGSPVTSKAGFSVQDFEEGKFVLSMPNDPKVVETGTWKLQISKHGFITTKNIPLTFRNNNGAIESNVNQMQTIKVSAVKYFGPTFDTLQGRLQHFENPQKIANVPITLQYEGMPVTFAATTTSEGRFTFTDVPAIAGQFKITVVSGSDIGQSDWMFIDHRMAQDAANGGNKDAELPFSMMVNFTGFKLDNGVYIKYSYNNMDYPVEGATLNIVSDDNTVSLNMVSNAEGFVSDIYIPKDGAYTIKATKGNVIRSVGRMNLSKNSPNKGWTNTNIVFPVTTTEQLLVFAELVTVNGTVKTAAGTAVAGAKVEFKAENSAFAVSANTVASGTYTVKLPKIGQFIITASKDRYERATNHIYVQSWIQDTLSAPDIFMNPVGSGDRWSLTTPEITKVVTRSGGTVSTEIKAKVLVNKNDLPFTGASGIKVVVFNASTQGALTVVKELQSTAEGRFEGTIQSTTATSLVFAIADSSSKMIYPDPTQYATAKHAYAHLIQAMPVASDTPVITSSANVSGKLTLVLNNQNYLLVDSNNNVNHRITMTLQNDVEVEVVGSYDPATNAVEIEIFDDLYVKVLSTGAYSRLGDLLAEISSVDLAKKKKIEIMAWDAERTSYGVTLFEY